MRARRFHVSKQVLFVTLMSAGSLMADTVTLTNGKVLEGRVTEDGDRVVVEMSQGSVKLNRSQIKSIDTKETPQDEFFRRSTDVQKEIKEKELDADAQAEKWFELAEFAAQKQLTRQRAELLKKIILINGDHTGARHALGFVLHDGRWLTRGERNQALGLVKLEGNWVPKEAVEDVAKTKEESRRQDLQDRRDEADLQLKLAETRKLEAEIELLESRRRAAQEEAEAELFDNRRAVYPYSFGYAYPTVIQTDFFVPAPAPVCTPVVQTPAPQPRPIVPVVRVKKPVRPVDNSPSYCNGRSGPGYPFLP